MKDQGRFYKCEALSFWFFSAGVIEKTQLLLRSIFKNYVEEFVSVENTCLIDHNLLGTALSIGKDD